MRKDISVKELGPGSLAAPIVILAIIFQFSCIGDKSIGRYLMNFFGIRFPDALIGLALFGLAVIIGYKYKTHRYAKVAANIAMICLIIFTILIIISGLF